MTTKAKCREIPVRMPTVLQWSNLDRYITDLFESEKDQPAFLIQCPSECDVVTRPVETFKGDIPVNYQKIRAVKGVGLIVEWIEDANGQKICDLMPIPQFVTVVENFRTRLVEIFHLDPKSKDFTATLEDCLWKLQDFTQEEIDALDLRIPYGVNLTFPKVIGDSERHVNLQVWASKLMLIDGRSEGITQPTTYLGCAMSVFQLHIEAESLAAANYMTSGSPKLWYIGHADDLDRYAEAIKHVTEVESNTGDATCSAYWRHKYLMINPGYLAKRRRVGFGSLKMFRAEQRPGQLMVVRSNSIHQGLNIGYNSTAAVNIVDLNWKLNRLTTPNCSPTCSQLLKMTNPYKTSQKALDCSDFDSIASGIVFNKPTSDYPADLWEKSNWNRFCSHPCVEATKQSPGFPYCWHLFGKPSELQRHNEVYHTGAGGKKKPEKLLECDECGRLFDTPSHLHQHQLKHNRPKPICSVCGKEFSEDSAMILHVNKVHQQPVQPTK